MKVLAHSAVFSLIFLSLCQLISSSHSVDEEWSNYIQRYGKKYATNAENQLRKSIFLSNLHEIERHNAQVNRTYTKAVNQFSDLTQSEFETEILTPQLAFAPIPNPPPTPVQTRSSSSSTACTVPMNCRRDASNCCISSSNPNACCSALGLGGWNRRQCSYDGSVNGVVPNGCVHHDSQCCRSSGNPSECCAALGFAWWDGEWCRGAHPANVPDG
ncbi:unnamed protein product, partial [Adineta ricciae]